MDTYIPPDNQSYEGLIKENGRWYIYHASLMDKVLINTHPVREHGMLEKTTRLSGSAGEKQ